MYNRLITELREKYPSLSKKSETSPLAAIRLFCMECMGGDRKEVKNCTAPLCPLYEYRFGKKPVKIDRMTEIEKNAYEERKAKKRLQMQKNFGRIEDTTSGLDTKPIYQHINTTMLPEEEEKNEHSISN